MTARRRLDAELVRRSIVASRESARREVEAGNVLVGGSIATKPARLVLASDAIELVGQPPPFVSRAGGKLAGALATFGVDPAGLHCLDAGSSTGGFTDCLLQAGAARVDAVDVGTHQLHERIRANPLVVVREQTDIRTVTLDMIDGPVDLVVGDLSFISLRVVLDTLVGLAKPGSDLLLLIKPQFEAGKQEASKTKGIIRDPEIWRRVIQEVSAASSVAGAGMMNLMTSPVRGTAGNTEFIGRFVVGAAGVADLDALLDDVIGHRVLTGDGDGDGASASPTAEAGA
ncbi:MAG: TlyA family RNA methyltransferase [Acidimicrobiales bacterium]